MLRAIFGVNVATQPDNSSSNSPQQKNALITEVLLPSCLEVSIKNSGNVGFYQSYYEEFQQEISRAFGEIRKSDQTKESKRCCGSHILCVCLPKCMSIYVLYLPINLSTNNCTIPTYLYQLNHSPTYSTKLTNLSTNQPAHLPAYHIYS